jgi:hypothetical protein
MDYIYRGSARKPLKQFGGILYSVISLAVISETSAEVFPVMNLGEDEYENVISFLSNFKNINTDLINRLQHKTRVVSLYYNTEKQSVQNIPGAKTYDREESSTEPTLPVEFEQVKDFLRRLDGILINMVSGVDLTLDTLKKIRHNFSGYIHMDLHNLVMQTFPDGKRVQMPLADWQQWCSCADTLQMNESEISVLTGANVTEYETTEKILSSGKVKSLVVTRGMQGVSLYEMKSGSGLSRTDIPAVTGAEFIDSTGCGDVFASGFFYQSAINNLRGFNRAAHFASQMAGLNTSLNGVEELYKLK